MKPRAEPSPLLVAALAAAAGLGGAWLAHLVNPGAPPAEPPPPAARADGPAAPAGSSSWTPAPGRLPGAPASATPVGVWATLAKAPAAGASLELHAVLPGLEAPAPVGHGTLDAQGHLGLELGPGGYLLTVRLGRAAASQAFEVSAGHPQQLLLALGDAWTARLSVVEAGSERPLSGAEARLLGLPAGGAAAPAPAPADSLGRLELPGLPPGPVRVRVSARGALPATVELAPGDGQVERVALEAAAFVAGTVLDENGTLLPGVRVRTAPDLEQDLTDAQGRFRAPCRPGDVVVVALDPAGRSATARTAVTAGGTATGVTLRLGEPRRLAGLVTGGPDGGPVAGALVRAEALGGEELARAFSAASGAFELDGLPEGWVNVRASLGRGARGAALGVDTGAREPVLVALEAPASLGGVVSAGPGQPVAGATVRVQTVRGEEAAWTAVTDTEGTYRLEDLPALPVRVEAALEGEPASGSTRVVLQPGRASTADLEVHRDGVVEGTARGPAGKRLEAFAFGGVPGENVPRTVVVGAGGRYRLRLPAGRWRVSARVEGGRLWVPDAEEVVVEAGQRHHLDLEAAEEPADDAELRDAYSVEAGTLGASFEAGDGEVRFAWLSSRGPAARGGVQVGEVLLAVDGVEVRDSLQAFERTRGAPGSRVSLRVRGAGGDRSLELRRQGTEPPRRAQAR